MLSIEFLLPTLLLVGRGDFHTQFVICLAKRQNVFGSTTTHPLKALITSRPIFVVVKHPAYRQVGRPWTVG